MKVLIAGGGIAGPVTATALARAGIDARVAEARPGPDAGGSFLTLAPNGLAVLDTLGLLEPVLAAAVCPTSAIEFSNGAGRRLGTIDDGSAELGADLQSRTLMRSALNARLAEGAAAQGVSIDYGRRLAGVEDHGPDGVTAVFADGSREHADVLLGADGLHSPVRRAMDPGAPAPSYTGLLNFGGTAPADGVPPTPPATTRMMFGRRAFFGHFVHGGTAYWFVNAPHPELDRSDPTGLEEWRAHLLGLFDGDQPAVSRILRAAPDDSFTPFGVYDIATLPRWSSGHIGLVGDAAHAVSSSSGQGASLALEDAVTVARCLRDIGDPAEALRTYEGLRRDRVERIVAEGRRRGNDKLAAGRVQVFLRDLMLPLVFRLIAARKGHAWMFDHRTDFDAPVAAASAAR